MRKQSRKYIPKHAKKRAPKQQKHSRTGAIVAASILSATSVAGTAAFNISPAAASSWASPTRSARLARLRYRRSYARVVRPAAPATADAWARLRACESGGNYATNTGNGYYGAYQFSLQTWHGLGYAGRPSDAAPEIQDQAAQQLQARSGWGQWPACSRSLGLR